MRKQALLGLLGLLGTCCSVMAAAVAVDDRPVTTEKSSVSRGSIDDVRLDADVAVIDDDAPGVPSDVTPVLIDPDMVFKHVVMGADGKVSEVAQVEDDEGGVAGPGERLIYENILGIHSINFPTNQPVSDDISTTAPDGCNLTRYKFKVLGKVLPTGASGAYTLTYGLYTNCPLAVGSTNAVRDLVRIPGTEGFLEFPDDAPRTIEHLVPAGTPVALPTNVYLGLRFNRGNCGTVIGAPAMTGFSGDIWDFPGFPCNGFLGGFPQLPHASFWLQMYGTTNCAPAFAGYKCQKPSGGTATLGAGIQGVDDVELIVNNCQMVGYEVVVRGVGFYNFDLRRECDGSIVAGSERSFQVNASTTPLLQVARFTFNPPVTLTTDRLYLGFKCSSNSAGAVIAGIDPIIGASTVDYFTIGLDGCSPVLPTSGVHGAVNLSITCGGSQPIGACCDPHLTQCNAGPDVGKRCECNATCQGGADNGTCCVVAADCDAGVCQPFCASPGTCESVCRQTTELNCPFPPRGQEQRPTWQQGELCSPDPFLPDACGVAACCHMRPTAANPNVLEEVCENLTKNECAAVQPLSKARLWQLGEYCGLNAQSCPRNACLARDGSCYISHTQTCPAEDPNCRAGCSDPFCCSKICALGTTGAFCCNTAWDSACVALAETNCTQPPPNDQCAPDEPVRGLEGALAIPFPGTKSTNNDKATESATDFGFCCHGGVGVCLGGSADGAPCSDEVDCPDLPGNVGTCSDYSPDPGSTGIGSIWFKWVQGSGTSAGISTCTSNSPALDTILQVFEANDNSSQLNACNSLSVIGCNDDAPNCGSLNRNSRICLQNLTPGKTYYILVASKTPQRKGQIIVTMSTSCSMGTFKPAPNDYCRSATPITDATPNDPLVVPFALGLACDGGPVAGKGCLTTADCRVCVGGTNAGQPCTVTSACPGGTCPAGGLCVIGPPTFDCPAAFCSLGAQNDVWYNYTATCSGDATFSTCGSGNPNTNIAVYAGCTTCPIASDNFTFLGCNADNNQTGCVEPGRVVVPVTQGQCYKVRIADQEGVPVSGNLTITCPPIVCPAGYVDCQPNGICDNLDIANCPAGSNACKDCNNNLRPDSCDIASNLEQDCQPNGKPDSCELAGNDCQPDGIPDQCGPSFNTGGNCPGPGSCPNGSATFTNPTSPMVDAGRPYPPNQVANKEGLKVLTVTAPAGAAQSCWTLCERNIQGSANSIVSAVEAPAGTYTITLNRPITTNSTTTITYSPAVGAPSVGVFTAHPGNVDGTGNAAPVDIIAIIDHLNGITLRPLRQCDVDRSGVCAGADIITEIDLLNGSNGFPIQNGTPKPPTVCP
jgi:hypothetical protein